MSSRRDLEGLPVLNESACKTPAHEASVLQFVSERMRNKDGESGQHSDEMSGFRKGLNDIQYRARHADRPLLIRFLEQMVQVESREKREELVKLVASIPGDEAATALARVAVFDLNESVRKQAIESLRERETKSVRPVFLAAMQHPWAAAADNAAAAL